MDSFGAIAGLSQISTGRIQVVLRQCDIGGVQVGDRVVTVHADRYLEHFIIFLASDLVAVGHREHFAQTQLLRTRLDNLAAFFNRKEPHLVSDTVVGTTQRRIDILQYITVRNTSVQSSQPGVFLIRIIIAVDDSQHSLTRRNAPVGLYFCFQAFPIFRTVIQREQLRFEVVFLPDIFGKCFHTIASQDRIGLVAAFRRCKTFQDNAFKRDVLIVYDRTDRIVDLRQFHRIVTEIRQDRIFTHLEVQISSPYLSTMFHCFRFRRDISQGRLHLIPLVGTGQDLVGYHERRTLFLFSTTAHIRDQHETGVFHPRFKRDYRFIVDDAFILPGLNDQKAGFILQVIQSDLAVIHFLADPSVQQDGR